MGLTILGLVMAFVGFFATTVAVVSLLAIGAQRLEEIAMSRGRHRSGPLPVWQRCAVWLGLLLDDES